MDGVSELISSILWVVGGIYKRANETCSKNDYRQEDGASPCRDHSTWARTVIILYDFIKWYDAFQHHFRFMDVNVTNANANAIGRLLCITGLYEERGDEAI